MNDDPGLFRFTELVMIVVFGVLIATVPSGITAVGLGEPTTLLLVVALLLYIEGYLVLHSYHRRLEVPYDMALLISDLVLIALYALVVRYVEAAGADAELLETAMVLAMILFVLLFIRQLSSYVRVAPEQLEAAGMRRTELVTSMVADFVGVGIALAIFIAGRRGDRALLTLDEWATVAFVVMLLYFMVKYLLVIRVSFGRPAT